MDIPSALGNPSFLVAAVLFIFAPIVGIYLGLWLISKGRSALSLSLYLAMAFISVPAFRTFSGKRLAAMSGLSRPLSDASDDPATQPEAS